MIARRLSMIACAFLVLVGAGTGCGRGSDRLRPPAGPYDEPAFAAKRLVSYALRMPAGATAPEDTVIGAVRRYRIREGDTLLDVARYYDLGYNEIIDANPGVDPWTPPVGVDVVVPTAWVIPCCTYRGLVLNIPELRLYFYRRAPGDPDTLLVVTHPVGLGRQDWRTPRGSFRIRGKTKDPTWIIPSSIRRERMRDKGDARHSIRGGEPDNPLGRYRLELSIPAYAIHGTSQPWGIGRQVSHGCAQLYPEDIERLFPLVESGMPVEFVYQPIKAGTRDDVVFIEVHPDIYGYAPVHAAALQAAIAARGLAGRVDPQALASIVTASRGMPIGAPAPAPSPAVVNAPTRPAPPSAPPAATSPGRQRAPAARSR
jgi:L,D-transpeptidase ErfK/SrfK